MAAGPIPNYDKRLKITNIGENAAFVEFSEPTILSDDDTQKLLDQLIGTLEHSQRTRLLLDGAFLEAVSSAARERLRALSGKMQERGGWLALVGHRNALDTFEDDWANIESDSEVKVFGDHASAMLFLDQELAATAGGGTFGSPFTVEELEQIKRDHLTLDDALSVIKSSEA